MAKRKSKHDLNTKLFGRPNTLSRLYMTGIVAHKTPEALHRSAVLKFPESASVAHNKPLDLYHIMIHKARTKGLVDAA